MTHQSKIKLLDAAVDVIRAKGYAASTVDDVCAEAGVTKGSFFHHFKGKDALAVEAAAHWGRNTGQFFTNAEFSKVEDPRTQLLAYIDFRESILLGDLSEYTCLLGTLVQETYDTHPDIRMACKAAFDGHIAFIADTIEQAKKLYAPDAEWTAASVSKFIQAVLQGAFVLAKAEQGPEVIRESLSHLRRYLKIILDNRT
jgi:TetR/AcrR family transcriptional regulator, transcriptional repressor for nem operon